MFVLVCIYIRTSPVAQMVKRLPAMQETWVRSPGREDPLEKEMATHSLQDSCLEIPRTEEPAGLQATVEKSRTRLSDFTSLHIYTDEVFSLKTEISVLSTILTVGF